MRYAIIENSKVVNVVLADAEYASSLGWIACPDHVEIGWHYEDFSFLPSVNLEFLAEKVRFLRNKKLADSDWTQVADAPVDKTVWASYRQALRDITNQEGFPVNVLWPTEP